MSSDDAWSTRQGLFTELPRRWILGTLPCQVSTKFGSQPTNAAQQRRRPSPPRTQDEQDPRQTPRDGWRVGHLGPSVLKRGEAGLQRLALHYIDVPLDDVLWSRSASLKCGAHIS